MNRMIKLFQQKSNRAFDQYLLVKKDRPVGVYPSVADVQIAVLKCESDIWAKAAELLRQEELRK